MSARRSPSHDLVIEAEAGDPADQRRFDDVGRVEPSAEADLEDAGVGRRAGEGEQGGGGGDFEEARIDSVAGVERFGEQSGELIVLDQLSGDADAFVEADEVRAGEDVDRVPGGLERGAQESAGRTLAVGAGDMEDGRKPVLRPAEAVEQRGDAVEPEAVAGVDRRSQPVELRLDRGIGRAREVGHHAAFLPSRGQIGDQPAQGFLQLLAVDDHVDHAVGEQIFGALESFGQLFADGLFDHPLPGEADQRAGLGDLDVAEHRIGCGDAAGRRVGQDDDVGQAGFLQFGQSDGRARHLHQRQDAFLHPRAAGRGEQDVGTFACDRGTDAGEEGRADRDAHRSAHEGEILDTDDGLFAADLAARR